MALVLRIPERSKERPIVFQNIPIDSLPAELLVEIFKKADNPFILQVCRRWEAVTRMHCSTDWDETLEKTKGVVFQCAQSDFIDTISFYNPELSIEKMYELPAKTQIQIMSGCLKILLRRYGIPYSRKGNYRNWVALNMLRIDRLLICRRDMTTILRNVFFTISYFAIRTSISTPLLASTILATSSIFNWQQKISERILSILFYGTLGIIQQEPNRHMSMKYLLGYVLSMGPLLATSFEFMPGFQSNWTQLFMHFYLTHIAECNVRGLVDPINWLVTMLSPITFGAFAIIPFWLLEGRDFYDSCLTMSYIFSLSYFIGHVLGCVILKLGIRRNMNLFNDRLDMITRNVCILMGDLGDRIGRGGLGILAGRAIDWSDRTGVTTRMGRFFHRLQRSVSRVFCCGRRVPIAH